MPFFTRLTRSAKGSRSATSSTARRVFAENAIVKNGKEAICYGLSGVPLALHCFATRSAPLQSRVGFVGGLQNRYAILHAGKSTFAHAFGRGQSRISTENFLNFCKTFHYTENFVDF